MMKTKILLVLSVVAMLITACKKEDPAANVYVKKIVIESTVLGSTATVATDYEWDNNLLVSERTTTTIMGMSSTVNYHYEYEGNNVIRKLTIDSRGDTTQVYNYTYENGRLKTFETMWGSGVITGYNSNGEITSYEDETLDVKRKFAFEWKDGDLVKAQVNKTYTDEITSDTTYVYKYDDKISPYTNMPIVQAIDDAESLGRRASKHNLLDSDYTYEYKSGRLVRMITNGGAKVSFYYTDGVGPDEE